jgi:hypothetical protein
MLALFSGSRHFSKVLACAFWGGITVDAIAIDNTSNDPTSLPSTISINQQPNAEPKTPDATQATVKPRATPSASSDSSAATLPEIAPSPTAQSAPAQSAPLETTAPVPPAKLPPTEQLQKLLATKEAERSRLEKLRAGDGSSLDRVELDRNAARDIEARLKLAILRETENFLIGNGGDAVETVRTEYASQIKLRKSLDTQYAALNKNTTRYNEAITDIQADIATTQVALSRLENAQAKLAILSTQKMLPKAFSFSETFHFDCSSLKSLSGCLTDKKIDHIVEEWLVKRYESSIRQQPARENGRETPQVNASQFSYTYTHEFSNASMDMEGVVNATVQVHASVTPKLSLACSILGVEKNLCSGQLFTLTVRSNKYDDNVWLEGASYGPSPVILALPKGEHNIQLSRDGKTLERKVKLESDKVVNFKFN